MDKIKSMEQKKLRKIIWKPKKLIEQININRSKQKNWGEKLVTQGNKQMKRLGSKGTNPYKNIGIENKQ